MRPGGESLEQKEPLRRQNEGWGGWERPEGGGPPRPHETSLLWAGGV